MSPRSETADDEAEDILALARTWLNSDAAGDDPPDLEVIDAVVIAQDGVTGEELWRGHLDAAATLTPGVMLMRGTLDFNGLEKALPLKVSATLERKVGAAADLTAENADLAVLARAVRLFGVTLPPVDGKFTGTRGNQAGPEFEASHQRPSSSEPTAWRLPLRAAPGSRLTMSP